MDLDRDVIGAAGSLFEDIHRHPEVAWHEHGTARRVRAFLERYAVPIGDCPVEPGIIVDIDGARPGRRVLLRADMDGLPIGERTDLPYRSTVDGVMHACGHDLHTAILAAIAVHLHARRASLAGSFRLVFQPSEETNPSGAEALVAAGVAAGSAAAMTLHVDPRIAVGCVGFKEGVMNAAVDGIGVLVKGRGGHAARPHLAVDPVHVGALLVIELQDLVRRRVHAREGCLLTITTFHAGERANVIPDQAWINGTLRTFSEAARRQLIDGIRRVCDGVTGAHGATYELDLRLGQPSLTNDPQLTRVARQVVIETLGAEALHEMGEPSLGGDDFSTFGVERPQMLIRLGVGPRAGAAPGDDLHTAGFRADPAALPIGVQALAALAVRVATGDGLPDTDADADA